MLTCTADRNSNIVELTVAGHVSKAEFDRAASVLEDMIDKHGSVRVLQVIHSFEGMDIAAFWEDMRFGLRHLNDFSCVAVVTDAMWIKWWAEFVEPFLAAEIKVFTPDELNAAKAWLRPAEAA